MFFMTFLFIGIGLATAQTSKVTGLVTSEEDGQPVVGASVLVNGTTLGTITDTCFLCGNDPPGSDNQRRNFKHRAAFGREGAGRGGRYRFRYQKKRENTGLCRFYSEK